jgi:hypothetical protein
MYLLNLHQTLYHADPVHCSVEINLVSWVRETVDLEMLDPTEMNEGSRYEVLSGTRQLGAAVGYNVSCPAV